MKRPTNRNITDYMKKRYGSIAERRDSGGCCDGGSCCTQNPTDISQIAKTLGYDEHDMGEASEGANLGLGCGNPLAHASLEEGEVVLDLGSGGGFDCFIARRHVGESGKVFGVDMTPQMISLARKNAATLGYSNVEFIEGSIEAIPIADSSIDVIISNCVINLSLDKQQVFHEAFRVLKAGGRLSVSDVLATAELPASVRHDLRLLAGCIAGAEYIPEVKRLLANAGFIEIKLTPKDTSREIISSWVPGSGLDRYVASYLIEAVKPT